VSEPIGAAFAVAGASAALDLQLHQTLRGKADHLAQQIGIRTLLQKRLKLIISSVIVGSSVRWKGANQNPTEDHPP
jgi:hypothetical protein